MMTSWSINDNNVDANWRDVDVTANTDVEGERRRNTDAPIDESKHKLVSTRRRRSENVDESKTGLASSLIDTDKLNSVTDYKWVILYFTSLKFYCL